MIFYLMQHGKALPKDQDPQKGLSPEGADEVRAAARGLKSLGVLPELFVSSPKKRARETAQLAMEALNPEAQGPLVSDTLSPLSPPEEALGFLKDAARGKASVFVAGHLPSLALLSGLLIAGEAREAVAFKNAGIVAIELKELAAKGGVLDFAIGPKELKRLGG